MSRGTYAGLACTHAEGCIGCGGPVRSKRRLFCSPGCREQFKVNHFWDQAIVEAMKRAKGLCLSCGAPAIEVHHKQPLNGNTRWLSCANHQENLEPLCLPCHNKTKRKPRVQELKLLVGWQKRLW